MRRVSLLLTPCRTTKPSISPRSVKAVMTDPEPYDPERKAFSRRIAKECCTNRAGFDRTNMPEAEREPGSFSSEPDARQRNGFVTDTMPDKPGRHAVPLRRETGESLERSGLKLKQPKTE